jgi:Tannase-like family of unknown function (DUF6351)
MLSHVRIPALLVCACFSTLSITAQAAPDLPRTNFDIVTVNNRADLISGGNAMVEVSVPKTVPLHQVTLLLNGQDVTASFQTDAAARTMRGVLTGLRVGENEFVADANGKGRGRPKASLSIKNHPIGGPVLSGAQTVPFFCATTPGVTATPTTVGSNASGFALTAQAVDAQCNFPAEFNLYYRTNVPAGNVQQGLCSLAVPDPTAATLPTSLCFQRYTAAIPRASIATTTTGVPFIVRVEHGTMNRGIYDLAVLVSPSQPWSALAPQAAWSGKVLYQFGASTGQPRRQARSTSSWTNELALSEGYLVAQNSMTDSLINSNRVLMAETVMMMKEHIGDTYGPIKFTMGSGCSGGSINSNMNASIAPGQLDGITISCAYPDSETTGMEVTECVLLAEAYQKPAWRDLMTATGQSQAQIDAKKAAINGHPDQTGCHGWYNAFGSNGKVGTYFQRFVLSNATGVVGTLPDPQPPAPPRPPVNNCQLPNAMVYDPVTNPTGPRCSAWDWAASIWGKRADGISARDTRDNTGVQYGLKAVRSGAITAEEFVTLNEVIGGVDSDSNFQTGRSVADANALEIAYRAGIVMSGRQLAKTAIIDMRGWDDSALLNNRPGSPIHFVWRSFSIRDRLDKQFGDHGNQVMWRFSTGLGPSASMQIDAFKIMDEWLTALKTDMSDVSIESKVRRAKPAKAFDYCVMTEIDPATGLPKRETDFSKCTDAFLQPHASPRQVAGGPLSEDILKCRLKPINVTDYAPAVLSAGQLARLAAVFPTGVCDWAAGGVGQQPAVSPLDFSGGPGGVPLPPAPQSQPRP